MVCRWHRQGKKAELSWDIAERSLTVWWRGGDGITGVKGSAPGGHWDGVVGGGIVAELTESATEGFLPSRVSGGPWRCQVALNSYPPSTFSPQCWGLGLL